MWNADFNTSHENSEQEARPSLAMTPSATLFSHHLGLFLDLHTFPPAFPTRPTKRRWNNGFPWVGQGYMVGGQVLMILVLTAGTAYKIRRQTVALRPSTSKWLLSAMAWEYPPKREKSWSPGSSSLKVIKLYFYKEDTINRRILNPPFKWGISNSPMGTLTGDVVQHRWEMNLVFLHAASDSSNFWIRPKEAIILK